MISLIIFCLLISIVCSVLCVDEDPTNEFVGIEKGGTIALTPTGICIEDKDYDGVFQKYKNEKGKAILCLYVDGDVECGPAGNMKVWKKEDLPEHNVHLLLAKNESCTDSLFEVNSISIFKKGCYYNEEEQLYEKTNIRDNFIQFDLYKDSQCTELVYENAEEDYLKNIPCGSCIDGMTFFCEPLFLY